jgi:hypothetical protein
MAIATWSALEAEGSNVAGTALDNKATGTTTFIKDIDNIADKAIYLSLFFSFASFTPAGTTPSITVFLRRKRGGVYAENILERQELALTGSGTRPFSLNALLRIPNAEVYGLYWTSTLGANTAVSGNTLFERTWNEEIT